MLAIWRDAGRAPNGAHRELRCPEGLHHLKGLRIHRLQRVVLSTGQHSACTYKCLRGKIQVQWVTASLLRSKCINRRTQQIA